MKYSDRVGFFDDTLGYFEDNGCAYSKKCLDCRFKQCIYSLKHKQKQLILNANTLFFIFSALENGFSTKEVELKTNIPSDTIRHYLKRKESILSTINQYV